MKRLKWFTAAISLALVAPTAAFADSAFYGLLRSRDLTPFGSLRLDMRPAHAVAIQPGTWVVETELGYQNTWALSREVETYLTNLESQGRRDLGPDDLQAIRDLPGENYLLDLEAALLDVTFHYKFSQDWTGYLIVSAVDYSGGFLDGAIEDFHETFGFSSYGRPAVSRNDVNLIFDLNSADVALFGSPVNSGFMDPTLGVRYVGLDFSENWKLALEAAVKVPVGGKRLLLSTGHADYGAQAYLRRRGVRNAFHVALAAVYYAGAEVPVPHDEQVIPTLILGYEFRATERTNINLQAYVSESVYSRNQTDLDELTAEKYQLSLGVRHRRNGFLFSFGITENLQNYNNTPDIGFQLGIAYFPDGALR